MAKVLAVNNYPTNERFERLRRCFEEAGATVTSNDWVKATSPVFNSFDGVVLSGSPDMLSKKSTQGKFSAEAQAVRECEVPLLGVCFGHQLIAHAFGATVAEDSDHVLKFVKTEVVVEDTLFEGLPRWLVLLESRHEVVGSLPQGFELTARSETSEIAGMRHTRRPIYGLQFHPERYSSENPDGKRVVENFVKLLRR